MGRWEIRDTERLSASAEKVARTRKQGHNVLVVVSAMGGMTDLLLDLGNKINSEGEPRERDMLASSGEQISSGLMALALQRLGCPAISFNGMQIDLRTDSAHTRARIQSIDTDRIFRAFEEGKVVVVAGFQGVSEEGDITTLGRGGSDTTAVALAAAIGADVCEIYTDVTGVFTASPNVVPRAKKIDQISFDEMLELASLGAKVLHTRSVEFAKNYEVPLYVLSSFEDVPGTLVTEEAEDMEKIVVRGVTAIPESKISLVGVPDKPGIAAKIFSDISQRNINVDMIIQNVGADDKNDISFTVGRGDLKDTLALAREMAEDLGAEKVESDDKVAKVSVVGVGMRSHSGVASRMFKALADRGINIQLISTSEIKISCIIAEDYSELAVRALAEEFDLEEKETE